ncbi:MAG: acetate kinase [Bdellovibrionota bacterium]
MTDQSPPAHILVLNAGSSSLKSALFALEAGEGANRGIGECVWKAQIDWPRSGKKGELRITVGGAESLREEREISDHRAAFRELFLTLWGGAHPAITSPDQIKAVGHRIVHGGTKYRSSVLLTPQIEQELASYTEYAPLHVPSNIEAIRMAEEVFGNSLPQIAVFDTAFHSTLSDAAAAYALPYEWFQKGVRRYGFHGISHASCARRSAELLRRRQDDFQVVTCHLGSGCSLAAVKDGRSVDTTMGFTPIAGLMMGTRSGSVDPGALLYMQKHEGLGAVELERILNFESGLLGVSGVSSDMRDILEARAAGNSRAALAFDMFVHVAAGSIAKMASALDRLDAIAFTGGIGEHSPDTRQAIVDRLSVFGVRMSSKHMSGASEEALISAPESAFPVLVIPAREEAEIARECSLLLP